MPNHRTRLRGAAGPAGARGGRGPGRAAPADDGAERRQDRAGADVPSRHLRDRRRLRHHERRRARRSRRSAVFPVDARHQDAGHAELDGAGLVYRARSSTTRPTSSRRSSSASSTSWRPIRRASSRTRRTPTTAGSGWSSTISSPRGCRGRRQKLPREFYARKLDGGLYSVGHDRAGRDDRPGRDRRSPRSALRRAAGAGRAREAREGARPRRRLRDLHGDRGAALLAAEVAARDRAQLGLGDRAAHDHHQERVLSAEPRERALDGEDESDRAEAEGAAGTVRERQAAAADQDDGDVQAGEDQSAGRLPADPRADPGLHRALLGAAVGGRAAQRAVDRLDHRTSRRRTRTSCCRSSTRSPRICR